jgi:thiamine-phosphate pyrophosphorylase
MRGLYAIVDVDTLQARGFDTVAFADAVLSASPAALQLRAKSSPPRETLALLRALAPLCRRAGVPLVANDRPDLAILAGCSVVHVGQSDMPLERVRRIAPGLDVGVSTHDLAQLTAALAARPAYVAFGPVFETSSKKDHEPVVGVAALRGACALARAVGISVVAIGGITFARAATLVGVVDAVAVIGELVPAAGESLAVVAERALALQGLFVEASVIHAS